MIRSFEVEDTEQLVEVWRAASRQAHMFIDEGYWPDFEQKVREVTLLKCQTTVFHDDGIRGFICLDNDHVDALFIDPKHQRRGIGKILLDHAKANAAQLTLAVFTENASAVDFYRREGFSVVSQRPNVPTGNPMVILKWSRGSQI